MQEVELTAQSRFVLMGNKGSWERPLTGIAVAEGELERIVDGQCAGVVGESRGKQNIVIIKVDFV